MRRIIKFIPTITATKVTNIPILTALLCIGSYKNGE